MIKIDNIYVNKILVFKEELYGTKNSFKYFIGYNNDDVIRPLYIKLPQMIGYGRSCKSKMAMSFKVNDDKLLKKYNQIWKKVKSILKIKFDSEPVYGDNEKYTKTKIEIWW